MPATEESRLTPTVVLIRFVVQRFSKGETLHHKPTIRERESNMKQLTKLLAISAVGSIFLGTALEAQTLDPTGTYDVSISADFDGQIMELSGITTFETSGDGLAGSIEVEVPGAPASGPGQLSNITVEGMGMTFSVDAEGMVVSFRVRFGDEGFRGTFDLGGFGGGTITGVKR